MEGTDKFAKARQELALMDIAELKIQNAIEQTQSDQIQVLIDYIEQNLDDDGNIKPQSQVEAPNQQGVPDQGKSITGLVDAEMTATLMSLGYSQNVAEKALFLTQNVKTVEAAIDWIEQNKFQPDFEEQLFVVEQQKMTKEEFEDLIKQRRLQKQRKIEEDEKEKERTRLRVTKELQLQAEILKEEAIRKQIELNQIEKAENEALQRKMIEDLERQRAAQKGVAYVKESKPIVVKSKEEQFHDGCLYVINYCSASFAEKAHTCLSTIKIYIDNIIKSPTEDQFHQINTDKEAFQNRVGTVVGGVECLKLAGFVEESGFLAMKNLDVAQLKQYSEILDQNIAEI